MERSFDEAVTKEEADLPLRTIVEQVANQFPSSLYYAATGLLFENSSCSIVFAPPWGLNNVTRSGTASDGHLVLYSKMGGACVGTSGGNIHEVASLRVPHEASTGTKSTIALFLTRLVIGPWNIDLGKGLFLEFEHPIASPVEEGVDALARALQISEQYLNRELLDRGAPGRIQIREMLAKGLGFQSVASMLSSIEAERERKMAMFQHVTEGPNDIEATRQVFQKAVEALAALAAQIAVNCRTTQETTAAIEELRENAAGLDSTSRPVVQACSSAFAAMSLVRDMDITADLREETQVSVPHVLSTLTTAKQQVVGVCESVILLQDAILRLREGQQNAQDFLLSEWGRNAALWRTTPRIR